MKTHLSDPGYPHPSSPQAQRRMLACGPRDTAPELALRSLLFQRGLRYRVDIRPIPSLRRKADVIFPRLRIAVFIDGCFWHGCPRHATWPKANSDFWFQKIVGNRDRDADTDARLSAEGWLSVRVWEHEDAAGAAERIAAIVSQRKYELSAVVR